MKVLLLTTLLFISSSFAKSSYIVPFSSDKFEKMKKDKKDFVVFVYATWCPKCRREKNIVDKYLQDKKSSNTILLADYDSENDFRTKHKVFIQGVMLNFQKGKEVVTDRYMEGTNEEKLKDFLNKTLNAK